MLAKSCPKQKNDVLLAQGDLTGVIRWAFAILSRVVHSDRLVGLVLTEENAIQGLPDVLRGTLSYSRGELNLACMSFGSYG